MPQRRVLLPGHVHHIIARGHRQQMVFVTDACRYAYLRDLHSLAAQTRVAVHAWCLMSNHVHLLLATDQDPFEIAILVKRLHARATGRWNRANKCKGTLWDGRYVSRVITTEDYLFRCCKYIERNPVSAGMVDKPEDYHWSSYRTRMGLATGWTLAIDEGFLARRDDYRKWVEAG